jgi:hypothetical protein
MQQTGFTDRVRGCEVYGEADLGNRQQPRSWFPGVAAGPRRKSGVLQTSAEPGEDLKKWSLPPQIRSGPCLSGW